LPKDQPDAVINDSDTVKNTSYLILSNADRYPIIVNRIRNQLRILTFESKTLHELLNILKQRLDETRNKENKEDLAELWTKYHIYAREIEQQIEDHTTVIATYEFEHKAATYTTSINERLTQFNRMINEVRTQLDSQLDNI
jgi:hypothetical protein